MSGSAVSGVVVSEAIVLVGTVSRAKVAGCVVLKDYRIGICCVEGYCCEGGGVGSWYVSYSVEY